jgi:hypothetical protein
MKRPSFQFYPGDWTSNSNLRRCSHAERGIWIQVLCVMHDSEEYGLVRWPLKEIAQAVNCSVPALRGLVEKGILKGADTGKPVEPYVYIPRSGRKDGDPVTLVCAQVGPLWYSSRMVKDEYVRTIRGESTRFGAGDGDASKGSPKTPFGDGSSASPSSPTSPSGGTNSVLGDGEDSGENVVPIRTGLLSRVMREFGIQSNPADPRIVALAGQGVTPETVRAACEQAKLAKPNETVAAGYIVSILQRWAAEASNLKATGAKSPAGGKAQKFDPVAYVNQNRASNDHERPDDYIDV